MSVFPQEKKKGGGHHETRPTKVTEQVSENLVGKLGFRFWALSSVVP